MPRSSGKRKALQTCRHIPPDRAAFEGLLSNAAGLREHHHVCLACGLQSPSLEQHQAQHHCVASKPGHEVVLSVEHTELFCTACKDYVYSGEFDALRLAIQRGCSNPAQELQGQDQPPSISASMPPANNPDGAAPQLAPPAAAAATAAVAAAQPLPPQFQPTSGDGFPAGLRGLNNMGNTCFMNSVLQGLLHAPLLRNYYLLGRHCKAGCPITADGGYCVSCELDEVFNEVYSGVRTAYSPAQFLYTWWMLAGSHLGSYQQHDAHEFFLFVLEMLSCTPGAASLPSKVFGGTLRSDVICSNCGNASTTQDPFTHLSLDIPPREQLIPLPILPRPSNANAGGGSKAGAASGKAAGVGKGGGSGAAGAAKVANGRRAQGGGTAAAAAAAVAAAAAAGAPEAASPIPSSSTADQCTSSGDVEILNCCEDEAAGSTLVGAAVAPDHSGSCMGAGAGAGGGAAGGAAGAAGAQQEGMSQLEAASAVGGPGGLVSDSEDAAQDTLSSPRMGPGAAPRRGPAANGPAAARGKPPIPKSGRTGKKAGGAGGQARRQSTPGEAEPGPATLACISSGTLPGLTQDGSDVPMAAATQDALAANSNLPGSQSTAAAAAAAAALGGGPGAPQLPPQLAGYQRWPAASLLGCLNRFVRQEQLGPSERVECTRCCSPHAIKQLSLRQLPPVLVLHTKRFEHPGGLRAAARKLETDLAFPLHDLDMRPFLSSSLLRSRHKFQPSPGGCSQQSPGASPAQPAPAPGAQPSPPQQQQQQQQQQQGQGQGQSLGRDSASPQPASSAAEDCLYSLFAVVCHRGSFQGGHYVAYVRGMDGRWYLCDDAWVRRAKGLGLLARKLGGKRFCWGSLCYQVGSYRPRQACRRELLWQPGCAAVALRKTAGQMSCSADHVLCEAHLRQ